MTDVDSTSLPPRLSGAIIANTDAATATIELSAANRSSFLAGTMLRGGDVVPARPRANEDAASSRHALHARDGVASHGYDGVPGAVAHNAAEKDRDSVRKEWTYKQQLQLSSSKSNSQDTTSTANDTADDIFTPPASASVVSQTNSQSNEHDSSSQESQLLQLSQIAATREKIQSSAEGSDGSSDQNAGRSRKRTADGMVKSATEGSSASPLLRGGHSRNTSTVSVASTTGSHIGEVTSMRILRHTRTTY